MRTSPADTSTAVRRFVPEPPFSSLRGLARYIAIAGLAGLIAGITVGGIGGRLFMRIAGAAAPDRAQGAGTEAGFTVGEVTAEGTIGLIVFIGIFTGVIGAVIYLVSMPWLSWAGRWRGLLFGILLFAIGSATSDVMNPDNFDFFVLKNEVLLVGLIVLLFLGFGIVLDRMARVLDRRIPAVGERWRVSDGVFIAITLVGLMLGVALLPVFFTREACDCDPPLGASWAMIVMAAGTVLWWASALISGSAARLRTGSGVLGYIGLVGMAVFGLIRAISDAVEIIG